MTSMHTLKILVLTSMFTFPRYDVGGGCVSNFAHSTSDLGADMATGLQVTPTRISVSTGGTLQITGGAALAGQSVQLKQGALTIALGTLDGQGQLQKALAPADLATVALGPAQVAVASGGQTGIRFYIEPKLNQAPVPFAIGSSKVAPKPVWVGINQKKILTLNFSDSTGMSTIEQTLGEYIVDPKSPQVTIIPSQQPIYVGYSRDVFSGNYTDAGATYKYTSTGAGLTVLGLFLAESKIVMGVSEALLDSCPLDNNCMTNMLTARPYSRITGLTANSSGTLFAAVITGSGSSPSLMAFSDGILGKVVAIAGASTSFPHETMLGAGSINEDALPDLLTLSPTGVATIFLGNNGQLMADAGLTGAMQQVLNAAQVTAPTALGMGDVDGDGLDDIAVASNAQVVIWLNQGAGQFAPIAGPTIPAGLAPVTSIAIGDVSVGGKGIPDLVLGSQDQHSIGAVENSATY